MDENNTNSNVLLLPDHLRVTHTISADKKSVIFRIATPPSGYRICKKSLGQFFIVGGEQNSIKIPLAAAGRSGIFKNAIHRTLFDFPVMKREIVRGVSDYLCHGFAQVSIDDVHEFCQYAKRLKFLGFVVDADFCQLEESLSDGSDESAIENNNADDKIIENRITVDQSCWNSVNQKSDLSESSLALSSSHSSEPKNNENVSKNSDKSQSSWSYLEQDNVSYYESRKRLCLSCQNPFTRSNLLTDLSPAYRLLHGVPYRIVKNWIDGGFDTPQILTAIFDFSLLVSGYTEKQLADGDLQDKVLKLMGVGSSNELVRYGIFGFRRLGEAICSKSRKRVPRQICVSCTVCIRTLKLAYKHDVNHGVSVETLRAFGQNDPTGKINFYSEETLRSLKFSLGESLEKRMLKVRQENLVKLKKK